MLCKFFLARSPNTGPLRPLQSIQILKNYPSATLTKRNGNREWRIHAGKEMYLLFFWRTVLYLTLLRFVLFALLFLLCSAGVALLCFACFPLLLVALQMKLNGHSNCIVLLCFVIGEFWTVMVKLG